MTTIHVSIDNNLRDPSFQDVNIQKQLYKYRIFNLRISIHPYYDGKL